MVLISDSSAQPETLHPCDLLMYLLERSHSGITHAEAAEAAAGGHLV